MAHGPASTVLRHLRRLLGAADMTGDSDGRLLERFVSGQDESAFAELMDRHGPMVLGVCRRVLRNAHDAEDVFQASFLVLVRKAASITKRDSFGSWLYWVAYRLAIKARAQTDKRQAQQRQVFDMIAADQGDSLDHSDLAPVLDEELARLPEKYRAPLVLCYLEGKTSEQAARELGWPKGTVFTRLNRGRDVLRRRLTRRGLALAAAAVAPALSENLSQAAVPHAFAAATLQAAHLARCGSVAVAGVSPHVARLTEGMVRSMLIFRWKIAAVVLLVLGAAGSGAGILARQLAAPPQADAVVQDPAPNAPDDDPLPAGATCRLGTLRFRHASAPLDVVFAADGKTIASAADKHIRIWDTASGKQIGQFPQRDQFRCFASDGKTWLSFNFTTAIAHLNDLATGKELHKVKIPLPRDWRARGGPKFALSANGKTLAYNVDVNYVEFFDVATGAQLSRVGGDGKSPESLMGPGVLSPDGSRFAGYCRDGHTRLWQTASGKQLTKIKTFGGPMAFSPDGKMLAQSKRNDQTREYEIHFWDTATGQHQRMLSRHKHWTVGLAFSPDGRTLAATHTPEVGFGSPGTNDSAAICLWDVASGRELRVLESSGHRMSTSPVFSPDGRTLAAAGANGCALSLWDVATGKFTNSAAGHNEGVNLLAISPDGRALATATKYGDFRSWDLSTGKEQHLYSAKAVLLAFARDGRRLASVDPWSYSNVPANPNNRLLRLWNANGDSSAQLNLGRSFHALALSADLHWAATSTEQFRGKAPSESGILKIWDVAAQKQIHELSWNGGSLRPLAFTPDGRRLAAYQRTDRQGLIRFWDVPSGKEGQTVVVQRDLPPLPIPRKKRWPPELSFSSEGRTLLLVDKEAKTVQLFEVASGKERLRIKTLDAAFANPNSSQRCLCFSADLRVAAFPTGEENVRLVDVGTGKELGQLRGHRGAVTCLIFTPDGKSLITGSADTTALVWDVSKMLPASVAAPTAAEVQTLWADLGSPDSARAYQAARSLAASPKQAVPFLADRLKNVVLGDPKQIGQLLQAMTSNDFAERQKAEAELERIGPVADVALEKALSNSPSLDLRKRLESLREKLVGPLKAAETLQVIRAIETLEATATPEARQALDNIARQAREPWVAREAKVSRERQAP